MKKTFLLAVLVMVVCSLAFGCAKKVKIQKVEHTKPPVTQNVAPPPAPVEQPQPQPPQEAVPAAQPGPNLQEITEVIEGTDIHFDFDKSTITQTAMKELDLKGAAIKTIDKNIQIEGHCDERGPAEYNMALGKRRANAARNYMITTGIDKGRLSIISYGEERPIDPGHNEEAWAKNRRAHFVILNK